MYGRSLSRRYSDFRDEPTAATPLQPGKENPNVGTLPLVKTHQHRHAQSGLPGLPPNIRENVYMESRPLPSIPDLNEIDDDRSDRSSQNKVQVYRTSSGKEHYHNPKLVVNMRSDRSDRSEGSSNARGPLGPSEDPQYFVLDPDEVNAASSPPPCSSSSTSNGRPGFMSDKQKSPEEENAENFNKEVASTNSSLPDLPVRSSIPSHVPHCNPNEYSQGNSNSSWP